MYVFSCKCVSCARSMKRRADLVMVPRTYLFKHKGKPRHGEWGAFQRRDGNQRARVASLVWSAHFGASTRHPKLGSAKPCTTPFEHPEFVRDISTAITTSITHSNTSHQHILAVRALIIPGIKHIHNKTHTDNTT